MKRFTLLACLVLPLITAAQTVTYHAARIVPPTPTWVAGSGINNSGHVTGSMGVGPDTGHAFLYKNGTLTDLGTLAGNSSSYGSRGSALNDSDWTGGASELGTVGSYYPGAFLWVPNNPLLSITAGQTGGYVTSISNSGVVTGAAITGRTSNVPFVYSGTTLNRQGTVRQPGTLTVLPLPSGALSGEAYGSDTGGNIVVRAATGTGDAAYLYTPAAGGGYNSNLIAYGVRPTAMNVYGHFSGVTNNFQVVLYKNGTVSPYVTPGQDFCWSLGINKNDVIVGYCGDYGTPRRAYIWDASGNATDLNSILATPVAWSSGLTNAAGINDLGQIVANVDGLDPVDAYILTPDNFTAQIVAFINTMPITQTFKNTLILIIQQLPQTLSSLTPAQISAAKTVLANFTSTVSTLQLRGIITSAQAATLTAIAADFDFVLNTV